MSAPERRTEHFFNAGRGNAYMRVLAFGEGPLLCACGHYAEPPAVVLVEEEAGATKVVRCPRCPGGSLGR